MRTNTKRLTAAAVFSALAFGISLLCNVIPVCLVPGLPFLHYDAKDVLITLCGFIYGPVYALAVSLVASVLEFTISSTGVIGMIMNFLSSAVFACTASLIYKYIKNIKGAILGLFASVVLTTAFMLGWNYLISPYYMGVSREAISAMLLPGFLPFNLLKSGINMGICLLVYKPVITTLRMAGFVERKGENAIRLKSSLPSLIIGILAILVCIAVALHYNGII